MHDTRDPRERLQEMAFACHSPDRYTCCLLPSGVVCIVKGRRGEKNHEKNMENVDFYVGGKNYLWHKQINVHLFVDSRIIISYMWPCRVFLFFKADISVARDNRKTFLIFLFCTEIIFRSGTHNN